MTIRQEHLGNLAHLMNCTPPIVDGLFVSDFFQLIMYVEAYLKAQKENS